MSGGVNWGAINGRKPPIRAQVAEDIRRGIKIMREQEENEGIQVHKCLLPPPKVKGTVTTCVTCYRPWRSTGDSYEEMT